MASAVSTQKIASELYVRSWDHDPGATSAIIASPDGGTTKRYMDLKDYSHVMVVAKPTVVGGGGTTKLEIVASATTDFASVTVVKDSGTVAADALDDQVVQECSAEEVVHLGDTLRYVAARLTNATNTDEVAVTYIGIPRRPAANTTATTIT